jgi:hypothetical protein
MSQWRQVEKGLRSVRGAGRMTGSRTRGRYGWPVSLIISWCGVAIQIEKADESTGLYQGMYAPLLLERPMGRSLETATVLGS